MGMEGPNNRESLSNLMSREEMSRDRIKTLFFTNEYNKREGEVTISSEDNLKTAIEELRVLQDKMKSEQGYEVSHPVDEVLADLEEDKDARLEEWLNSNK